MNAGLLDAFGTPPTPGVSALSALGSIAVPAGAVFLDFPSVVTSNFDAYSIFIDEVKHGSGGSAQLNFSLLLSDGTVVATTLTTVSSVSTAGASVVLTNANGPGIKLLVVNVAEGFFGGATSSNVTTVPYTPSSTAAAVKGFRVSWGGGEAFAKQGRVSVYGWRKF